VTLAIVAIVDPGARGLGVVALALLAAFVRRQAPARRPLLPLGVLRSRIVAGANAVHALTVGAMFGFQFLVTLYFQRVLGYSPAQAGLAVLPVALGIGAMSLFVFGRVEARHGARAALLPGLLAIAAGLALLARVPVDGHYLTDVAPSVSLFAVGAGLVLPAVMTIAMSEATPSTAGVASGLINTSQQVGGALGLAILAALAAGRADRLREEGAGDAAAAVAGFHLAWLVAAAFVLAAFGLASVALRRTDACPDAAAHGSAGRGAGGLGHQDTRPESTMRAGMSTERTSSASTRTPSDMSSASSRYGSSGTRASSANVAASVTPATVIVREAELVPAATASRRLRRWVSSRIRPAMNTL
jgi:hypothetical protein